MRFSMSSTFRLGANHCDKLGIAAELAGVAPMPPPDALAKFCKKSKPGTNFPKPEVSVLLMGNSLV